MLLLFQCLLSAWLLSGKLPASSQETLCGVTHAPICEHMHAGRWLTSCVLCSCVLARPCNYPGQKH